MYTLAEAHAIPSRNSHVFWFSSGPGTRRKKHFARCPWNSKSKQGADTQLECTPPFRRNHRAARAVAGRWKSTSGAPRAGRLEIPFPSKENHHAMEGQFLPSRRPKPNKKTKRSLACGRTAIELETAVQSPRTLFAAKRRNNASKFVRRRRGFCSRSPVPQPGPWTPSQ